MDDELQQQPPWIDDVRRLTATPMSWVPGSVEPVADEQSPPIELRLSNSSEVRPRRR